MLHFLSGIELIDNGSDHIRLAAIQQLYQIPSTGSHGHYYEGNYHAAKEDFAVRSGLISRAQLFSSEQLTELYRTTDFFLEEGPEPEEKQMKALQEARTKIEYTVPDLQERLEVSQEPEMNL